MPIRLYSYTVFKIIFPQSPSWNNFIFKGLFMKIRKCISPNYDYWLEESNELLLNLPNVKMVVAIDRKNINFILTCQRFNI